MNNEIILKVKNLKKNFQVKAGYFLARRLGRIQAVDDLSFHVSKGEIFGLVGESGCGKTTAGRIIAGLIPADSGSVVFDGVDVLKISGKRLCALRQRIQFIFQDPLSSLNPRMSVFESVAEPLIIHKKASGSRLKEIVASSLDEVGIPPQLMERFPHQLSGGQRQRVLIARSLCLSPDLVIADEPVSALDVSIQAQVLNLIKKLQDNRNFSSLFITHDLAVVRHVSRRAGVMYMGKMVEIGPVEEIFSKPLHPYTHGLAGSAPDITRKTRGQIIPGEIPDPLNPPSGCAFYPRCNNVVEICRRKTPQLTEKSPGRLVACHLV